MVLHKGAWLAAIIFVFTFLIEEVAESQTPLKDPISPGLNKKKWEVLEGFRSAKFGMTENQVKQAIAKDFKISKKKVERAVNPGEKTTALTIHLPKLMALGGAADIVYILGHKSRKLIQVNIDWGAGVSKKFNPQDVVDAGNFLRNYFMKKRIERLRFKGGWRVNTPLENGGMLLFRGKDQKGRMTLLTLKKPHIKGITLENSNKTIRLILSYILSPYNQDTLNAKDSSVPSN
jgi:hypothetical protein